MKLGITQVSETNPRAKGAETRKISSMHAC